MDLHRGPVRAGGAAVTRASANRSECCGTRSRWSEKFDVYYCVSCWKWLGKQCDCAPGELCVYSVSIAGKMPPDARNEPHIVGWGVPE